jgi:hypothetical protein
MYAEANEARTPQNLRDRSDQVEVLATANGVSHRICDACSRSKYAIRLGRVVLHRLHVSAKAPPLQCGFRSIQISIKLLNGERQKKISAIWGY